VEGREVALWGAIWVSSIMHVKIGPGQIKRERDGIALSSIRLHSHSKAAFCPIEEIRMLYLHVFY
jgi:hypothetical protein